MNTAALQSGNFRLYLMGNIFSLNGLWMLRVTVGWLAWDISGAASFVGLIAFLYYAPTMVASPLFGVLTDRVDVRRAALITQTTLCLLAALLLVRTLLGPVGRVELVLFSLAAGFVLAANAPIRLSLTPRLVAREHVASVVNFSAINFNLARMLGPALGGWLIATHGISVTLAVVSLFYVPFLAALTVITVRPLAAAAGPPPAFLAALLEGVRHVLADPRIRRALVLTAASSFMLRGVLEILPVLADGAFARGAAGLGVLMSAAGIGALLAGVGLMLGQPPEGARVPRATYISSALGAATLVALAHAALWPAVVILIGALAYFATHIAITCQTAIQSGLEDRIRGRVMSLWNVVAIGSTALGAAIQGAMNDAIGFGPTAQIAAALAALTLCIVLLRGRA